MTTVNRQHLVLPYGAIHWDQKTFSSSPGAKDTLEIDCHTRFVIIDPAQATPLRLNGGQYEFHEPPNMRLVPTVFDQLAYLETHFITLCGTYSKLQRLFINRYFDFIVGRVEDECEPLSKVIEDFGNLYEYHDWAFSAFRPLPQAYIYAPKYHASDATPQADDFTPTEMAFWTGSTVLVIDLSDPGSTDPFQSRRLKRIKDAGINILAITPAVLDDQQSSAFRDLLPEPMQNFWHGELAPSRPFVDTKLGDISASTIDF
jgi:hypothetical protein